MNFGRLLFWVFIIILCACILYHLGFSNNAFETFIAEIDECTDTGYANIKLKPKNSNSDWRKAPSNIPLLKHTSTIMGHSIPSTDLRNAPLGDEQDQMFMFAKNICSPECCPATYSCSGGCVCTTKKQRQLIDN